MYISIKQPPRQLLSHTLSQGDTLRQRGRSQGYRPVISAWMTHIGPLTQVAAGAVVTFLPLNRYQERSAVFCFAEICVPCPQHIMRY